MTEKSGKQIAENVLSDMLKHSLATAIAIGLRSQERYRENNASTQQNSLCSFRVHGREYIKNFWFPSEENGEF